jgi:hypothetical protein
MELRSKNKIEENQEEPTLKEEKNELAQEIHEKRVEMELENEIEREIMKFEKLITDLERKDNEVCAILRSGKVTQAIMKTKKKMK